MAEHKCRESVACTCDTMAMEPDEECPQHGLGPWPPRCVECGRFLPWSKERREA